MTNDRKTMTTKEYGQSRAEPRDVAGGDQDGEADVCLNRDFSEENSSGCFCKCSACFKSMM